MVTFHEKQRDMQSLPSFTNNKSNLILFDSLSCQILFGVKEYSLEVRAELPQTKALGLGWLSATEVPVLDEEGWKTITCLEGRYEAHIDFTIYNKYYNILFWLKSCNWCFPALWLGSRVTGRLAHHMKCISVVCIFKLFCLMHSEKFKDRGYLQRQKQTKTRLRYSSCTAI